MTRILVVTSCTGEKLVETNGALTLDDFQQGGDHLAQRERSLCEFMTPAETLYTGQQHVRLMRGVRAFRDNSREVSRKDNLELWVISAGYGLIPGDRKIAPYECTFQGMRTKALRSWADQLGVPAAIRKLLARPFDLALINLGDAYLEACHLGPDVTLGGPTILFCGTTAAKRLPRLDQLRVVTLSNPQAKRFSCGLVGLKGEVSGRILERMAQEPEAMLRQSVDPMIDVLDILDGSASPVKATRAKARVNPVVDRVITIPVPWRQKPHRDRLRYFIPEWDDLVDPEYDFETDTHSGGSGDWSNQVYAHQMYPEPNYDGILVSKVVAEKSKKKKERINALGVHRFLRVPPDFPVMGDCGAFGYIQQEHPPYSTEEILDYYTRLGFDYGVSVDHLIVTATTAQKQHRYELTIHNAEEFLKEHRKRRLPWEPIGAVQGWDAKSYTEAARKVVKMGYNYIALGGLVRTSTSDILTILEDVHHVVPDGVQVHLFGLARLNAISNFARLGVNSVDSASYLRQAWMRIGQSYLSEHGAYAALRIPEAGKSFRAKQMTGHAELSETRIQSLEQSAIGSVRALAREKCSVETCLDHLLEYDRFVTSDRVNMTDLYRRTLTDRPWERCPCNICRRWGVEVIIFRGNNRNRRRGFHNTYVFYDLLQKALRGDSVDLQDTTAEEAEELPLFASIPGQAI
ncbi:tRNA-guanine family transglycosylase [Singulisphaera sp. GP187]|uniref:tRNA-guanine transglycosylase DpdA n=1 Tax=Singulisphaera sp. GP187 TaxID=1882752 RepID=UPI00092C737B|nr:tRNA-guanine transglycosylase DpdA [Singulisphaera sp. GP187]SIO63277.1 tRNA-guanine family transglycosylase [Singulisphaera sp. GP187]